LPQSQLPKEDKTWSFREKDQCTGYRLAQSDWDIDTILATPSSVGLGHRHEPRQTTAHPSTTTTTDPRHPPTSTPTDWSPSHVTMAPLALPLGHQQSRHHGVTAASKQSAADHTTTAPPASYCSRLEEGSNL